MSLNQSLYQFFKTETQNAGNKLVQQDKVFISSHSDTQVQSTIRSFTPIKVTLKATSIENSNINARCSCKDFTKQKHCQHIWATLVQLNSISSDFLSNKNSLTLQISDSGPVQSVKLKSKPRDDLAKEKAAAFRKEQYLRMKDFKKKNAPKNDHQKQKSPASNFSQEIQSALDYFEKNGFPMSDESNLEVLLKAKKSLARIFHPDRGGSHDETVELNRNYEILASYLK